MDARAIHTSDAGYPARLTALADPPTPLWIRGDWTPARRAVALVGARAATAAGLEAARELGACLAAAGVDVISGGALGIDAASHRGALDVAARDGAAKTVAVLGTGIDVAYPERNAGMFEEIVASGGALVTQFEPGSGPKRGSFPTRNVIIAGLADVVVVVEAGLASGTTHTVRAMHALGRTVAALPGSHGTDALILARGAVAVAGADDVLALLDGKRPAPPTLPDDPLAAKIYAVLDETPRDVGELAFRAGLSVGTCAAMVVDLELGGLAARAAGGRYLRLR
jgi:DNA processing protein